MEIHSSLLKLPVGRNEDAKTVLTMLNSARNMSTSTADPNAELRRYADGIRLGREGRYTVYRDETGKIVAITHVTLVGGGLYELDAIACHPEEKRRGIGSSALLSTIEDATNLGYEEIGLFTLPKNTPFFKRYGFSKNSPQGFNTGDYVRMKRKL